VIKPSDDCGLAGPQSNSGSASRQCWDVTGGQWTIKLKQNCLEDEPPEGMTALMRRSGLETKGMNVDERARAIRHGGCV
jgi:hypothetical protein